MKERPIIEIPAPIGRVKVELNDAETGESLQIEEGENFIGKNVAEFMKGLQRNVWGAGLQSINAVSDAWGVPPYYLPLTGLQHLAYWNDSSAESSSTEVRIGANIIGWAARGPVGSPTGMRGVLNVTESEWTAAHAKWVFDWPTSTGNGTFQSVGWTNINEQNNAPTTRIPDDFTNIFDNSVGYTLNDYIAVGIHDDGTNWVLTDHKVTTTQFRVVTVPYTGGSASLVFETSGGDWSNNSQYIHSITKKGTDFYVCGGPFSGGYPQVVKYNSAGTLQWKVTYNALALHTYFHDITSDGTNLFAACNDGKVYRLQPSDGAVTATITPTDNPTGLFSIAYDSNDTNFWIQDQLGKLYKIDNSGNVQTTAPSMSVYDAGGSQAMSGVYNGTSYEYPGANNSMYAYLVLENSSRSSGLPMAPGSTGSRVTGITASGQPLYYKASQSKFYSSANYARAAPTETRRITGFYGDNLGSRILLGSPITKTSSQTLKITYELDFS